MRAFGATPQMIGVYNGRMVGRDLDRDHRRILPQVEREKHPWKARGRVFRPEARAEAEKLEKRVGEGEAGFREGAIRRWRYRVVRRVSTDITGTISELFQRVEGEEGG